MVICQRDIFAYSKDVLSSALHSLLSSNTCMLFAADSDALHSSIGEVSSFTSLENYLEEVARVKPVVAITEVLSQLQKSEEDVRCRFICKM